ncbi:hypothetical protein [Dongia deserti]|uniref:hypothetical protein n=1 Tax=Dongia deserti TaxID=2268030 RepID=UPI000E65A980|nr:hypothetical protein [Dongia deserti]
MIIVITVKDHANTFATFRDGTYGFAAPDLRTMAYEDLFCARRVPRATYIFADLERLSSWELQLAATVYRRLKKRGLRCLNDPARAMTRFELLRGLYRAGLNPFDVYRADEHPHPARFPVFLRDEEHHASPSPVLIASQQELEAALEERRAHGLPVRGALVVEHWPAPYYDGLWHKWGTFCVADRMSVDHISVDDTWYVKVGKWDLLNERAVAEEHEAATSNRFAVELAKIFAFAGIEFGRADHATVDGRMVVYEINTNPYVYYYVPDPIPLRRKTQTLARERLAAALAAIDCKESGSIKTNPPAPFGTRRAWSFGVQVPKRP